MICNVSKCSSKRLNKRRTKEEGVKATKERETPSVHKYNRLLQLHCKTKHYQEIEWMKEL